MWRKNLQIFPIYTYFRPYFVYICWHWNHVCDLQNHPYVFHIACFATPRFGTSLANSGFVMYQNQITHVEVWFTHGAPSIVRSEARRGDMDTSVHSVLYASSTDWSSWPIHAFDRTMRISLNKLHLELFAIYFPRSQSIHEITGYPAVFPNTRIWQPSALLCFTDVITPYSRQ